MLCYFLFSLWASYDNILLRYSSSNQLVYLYLACLLACLLSFLLACLLACLLSILLSSFHSFSVFCSLFHVSPYTVSFLFQSLLILFFLIKFNCSWRLGRMQCHAVSDGLAAPSQSKYLSEAIPLKLNSPPRHRQCHCLWKILQLPRLGCSPHALLRFSALGWVQVCLLWHALIGISSWQVKKGKRSDLKRREETTK